MGEGHRELPPGLEDPEELPEPRLGIGPVLEAVDRERPVEGGVVEGQVAGGAQGEGHLARLHRRQVPGPGHEHHLGRGIDAGDPAVRHLGDEAGDGDAGTEAHLQDLVVLGEVEAVDDPGVEGLVLPGHEPAADAAEEAPRLAEAALEEGARQRQGPSRPAPGADEEAAEGVLDDRHGDLPGSP